jgi:hypothetical protein
MTTILAERAAEKRAVLKALIREAGNLGLSVLEREDVVRARHQDRNNGGP